MQKKNHHEPEYTLNIFHHLDERTSLKSIVFIVQTTKQFISFNYQIILDVSVNERLITLKILGLKTTPLLMPAVGPARGRVDFTNLLGPYTINVIKLDEDTNQFQIEITPETVMIREAPLHPFMLLSNEAVRLPNP